MNNLELTSRILDTLKANSKDSRISRRLVLSTAESKAKFLISQKLNDRSLYREDNIYTEISCIELEDVDIIGCPIIEFRSCLKLKRSKKPLPELVYSRYGHTLKEVTSLDGQFSFLPITSAQYKLNKKRSQKSKDLYFYVKDNYLYLPDTDVKAVNLYLLTQDLYDLNECSECGEKCKSAWEYEFVCPDKLLEVVIQQTIQELAVAKQIQEDVNPNLNPNA